MFLLLKNKTSRQEYAMEKNYKILQEAFNTCGISKHIEVQKLVRAKYIFSLQKFCNKSFLLHQKNIANIK